PVSVQRIPRTVDAESVPLAGPDAGQVAMPAERGPLRQLDPGLAPLIVEETEIVPLGDAGVDREVRARSGPRRSERVRFARPDRYPRRAASHPRCRSVRHAAPPASILTIAADSGGMTVHVCSFRTSGDDDRSTCALPSSGIRLVSPARLQTVATSRRRTTIQDSPGLTATRQA